MSLDWAPAVGAAAGFHDLVGRDDRLADAGRAMGRTAHNFPRFFHDDDGRNSPALHDDAARPARVARPVHVRGSRDAVERRLPEPRHQDWQPAELPRHRDVQRRHGDAFSSYVPMSARMKAQFAIDGPRIHLDRIDMDTDGATTVATGDVDMAHWPEQTYQVQSRVNFPRMQQLFFKDEKWTRHRRRQLHGHVPSVQEAGPDLAGHVLQRCRRRQRLPLPRSCTARCDGRKTAFDIVNAGSKFFGGDARFTIDQAVWRRRASDRTISTPT